MNHQTNGVASRQEGKESEIETETENTKSLENTNFYESSLYVLNRSATFSLVLMTQHFHAVSFCVQFSSPRQIRPGASD